MEGIHVRDNIKSLHVVRLCMASSCILYTVTWGHVLCTFEIESVRLVLNRTSLRTQKRLTSIASLHMGSDRPYVFSGFFNKQLTSERFQIRCECATNQEPEAEDLYQRYVKVRHPITTTWHAPGTKKVLASDHSDGRALPRGYHPTLSSPLVRLMTNIKHISCQLTKQENTPATEREH